jgi:hypothetical protein
VRSALEVQPNETLLLWPGREHGGTAPYPHDLRFFWVHFAVRGGRNPGAFSLTVPQHARIQRPDHLTILFRRLLDDQEALGVQPLAGSLMILLLLWEVTSSRPASEPVDGAAPLLAARADTVIRTRFHEDISASTIAAELDCNPDYLGRVSTAGPSPRPSTSAGCAMPRGSWRRDASGSTTWHGCAGSTTAATSAASSGARRA